MLNLILREMGGMPAHSWYPRLDSFSPTFDVAHTDDAIVITADVPGLGDDDVSVTVAGRVLTIEGKRERRGYAGAFQKQFTLAEGLDLDSIEAQLDRGVLTVLVPKTPKAKPRQIKLGGGVIDKVKGLLGMERAQADSNAAAA